MHGALLHNSWFVFAFNLIPNNQNVFASCKGKSFVHVEEILKYFFGNHNAITLTLTSDVCQAKVLILLLNRKICGKSKPKFYQNFPKSVKGLHTVYLIERLWEAVMDNFLLLLAILLYILPFPKLIQLPNWIRTRLTGYKQSEQRLEKG